MPPSAFLTSLLLPAIVLYTHLQVRQRLNALLPELLLHTTTAMMLVYLPVSIQGHQIPTYLIPLIWLAFTRGALWMTLPAIPVVLLTWPEGVWPTLLLFLIAATTGAWTAFPTARMALLSLSSLALPTSSAMILPCLYLMHFLAAWANHHFTTQTKRQHQQHNKWHHDATHDALTTLGNRRKLEEDHKQWPSGVHLVMLDIDHFKRINDTYGHPTGDAVLRNLAEALQATTRPEDHLYRLGGEEFLVVLNLKDPHLAVEITERLRSAVTLHIRKHTPEIQETITVSAGISVVEEDFWSALKKADQQLYTAKNSGRNRLVTDQPVPPRDSPTLAHLVLNSMLQELHLVLEVQDANGTIHITHNEAGDLLHQETTTSNVQQLISQAVTQEEWEKFQQGQSIALQTQQTQVSYMHLKHNHLILVRMVPFEKQGQKMLATLIEPLEGTPFSSGERLLH